MIVRLKTKTIASIALLYLLIPVLLFISSWIKIYIAIPVVVLSIYCLYKYVIDSKTNTEEYIECSLKKILIISFIIFLWTYLSGIGGFVWQNRTDHLFRNAIFQDLIKYNWPVVNNDSSEPLFLCYYIGFWLPAAAISKLFSSALVGYIAQLLYGYIGLVISYLLISAFLKKVSYISLVVFIIFSGLHVVMILLRSTTIESWFSDLEMYFSTSFHIEMLLYPFNSSSNTTLLFWLYNQFVPFAVGFMLILLQKDSRYILFISSLLFLCSPFPIFGMIFLFLYLFVRNLKGNKISKFIISQLSVQNILALIFVLIIAAYYKSNMAVNTLNIVPLTAYTLKYFITYFVLLYLVYIIFTWNYLKKDPIFYSLIITIFIFSFIKMGGNHDFGWRTAIPVSFYLMLIVIKELIYNNLKFKKIALSIILIIGALTGYMDIQRTIISTYKNEEEKRISVLESVFIDNVCYENFIGTSDSFFYKYLMKK